MTESNRSRDDEHWDWLRQADHTASRDFDKAIMTLAGGALGVSIAFVHNVAPNPEHTSWLGAAWGCFALSLVLILVSFLASQATLREEMKKFPTKPGRPGILTPTLNWGSAIFLVMGVASLVVFALYNLGGDT